MSKDDPNNLNAYHNQGQEDRASGKDYDTPSDFLAGLFNQKRETEQNIAYREGWENAEEQDEKK